MNLVSEGFNSKNTEMLLLFPDIWVLGEKGRHVRVEFSFLMLVLFGAKFELVFHSL